MPRAYFIVSTNISVSFFSNRLINRRARLDPHDLGGFLEHDLTDVPMFLPNHQPMSSELYTDRRCHTLYIGAPLVIFFCRFQMLQHQGCIDREL